MIKLKRDSGWADRLRAYNVDVDGNTLGQIKNGEGIEFPISPGKHQMIIKVDWCTSNTIDFEIKENETVSFECGSNLRGIKILFAFAYVLFMRNKYLWLNRL